LEQQTREDARSEEKGSFEKSKASGERHVMTPAARQAGRGVGGNTGYGKDVRKRRESTQAPKSVR